jgi:endonuclease G
LTRTPGDLLTFGDNNDETELTYHHFSVKMNRPRRMCIFSAANIDGGQSKKKKRTGWKLDPRIPDEFQIIKECYGDPPKFSRGHMTRREDPVWGDDTIATVANSDTMHVTNATPQMQPFNAPIWLGLEDYALEHARQDKMQISVFTGPVFKDNDPVYYDVVIPITFWKVIAFIHDETGNLCATGYTMSQVPQMPPLGPEFVFGQYDQRQVTIASIQELTGLDFGPLVAADPFSGPEAFASPGVRLTDPRQIRFTA